MSLFSEPYFYAFLVANSFCYVIQRASQSFNGSSSLAQTLLIFIGGIATLLNTIFLILGFWFMESWWDPIICFAISFCTSIAIGILFELIPQTARAFALILAKIVTIVAIVVMYQSLFDVI